MKRLTGTSCWDERREDQTEAGDKEQPPSNAVHLATSAARNNDIQYVLTPFLQLQPLEITRVQGRRHKVD